MTRKSAIIDALRDAPETWTAAELARLETITGEHVTRHDLRTAAATEASPTIKHARAALAEALTAARAADFAERVKLLTTEILPAVDFLTAQRARIERGAED